MFSVRVYLVLVKVSTVQPLPYPTLRPPRGIRPAWQERGVS